jgi:hypothetical protein
LEEELERPEYNLGEDHGPWIVRKFNLGGKRTEKVKCPGLELRSLRMGTIRFLKTPSFLRTIKEK